MTWKHSLVGYTVNSRLLIKTYQKSTSLIGRASVHLSQIIYLGMTKNVWDDRGRWSFNPVSAPGEKNPKLSSYYTLFGS